MMQGIDPGAVKEPENTENRGNHRPAAGVATGHCDFWVVVTGQDRDWVGADQRSRKEVGMTTSGSRSIKKTFADAAARVSVAAGRPMAFGLALCIIIIWVLSGPSSRYSDTWQLVIFSGTTIVTFLMVFLIQNTQNRDSAAIQTKLDELIRASRAQNAFIGIEHLTQEEIEELRKKSEARVETSRHRA